MSTVNEEVVTLVKELPDDIMEHLYVKRKILKAQQQIKDGEFYTHEEAKEIMSQWQK